MPSDNNQEMFPIVDEQGNITGAATRGECHSGSKLLHLSPSSRFQFERRFISAETSGMERHPARKGTQPLADILTWAKV